MAFQISPGVLVQERDLTNVVPAVATTIGGIVGNFQWGPVHEIVQIDSENNLVERFGRPTTEVYYDFMTAASFLAYGSNLLTVREVGTAARNATADASGLLITNEDNYQEQFANGAAAVGVWAAKYAGSLGNNIKVEMADISSITTTSLKSIAVDSGQANNVDILSVESVNIDDAPAGGINATATATITAGVVNAITVTNSGFGYVTTPTVTLNCKQDDGVGGQTDVVLTATAALATSEWVYRDEFDSIPTTTTWAEKNGSSYDEMHIIVIDEDGGISGSAGTILEKFAGVSKARDAKDDLNQTNYYKNVINDRSKYIWWMDHPTIGSNWGESTAGSNGGIVFDTLVVDDTDQSLSLSGGVDDDPATGDIQDGYLLFANDELVDVALVLTSAHPTTVGDFVLDNVAEVRKDCLAFISPQRSSVVNNEGDELTDITGQADFGAYTRSSYGVFDSGWKYQYDKYNDRYVYVPLNGDVAGCCVVTDQGNDPWFSPAGLNRGIIKNAIKLAWSPRKAARDTLYSRGINPVMNTPEAGIVLFGDKTMLGKPSAFNRINVRRLFIVLEKAIATAAKFQLFEFNDAFTRAQFVALVEPFLRDVQGRRGIYDFRVVCDETNNTPQVIDSNEFRADIYVKPAKSINFITLTFIATRTGISFEELGA